MAAASVSTVGKFGMQLDAQRAHHLEDGGEARIALARQGLVEAFASQAGIAGQLRHALGAGNVPERGGDEGRVIARFRDASFQIGHHVLVGLEIFDAVPLAQFELAHDVFRSPDSVRLLA